MKRILCFGDSNTWGFNPADGSRHDENTRWTALLAQKLPEDIIIEEGCNGRTAVWDDVLEGYKNGQDYLIPCLESQRPLDIVVLMLGTNDCKTRFALSSSDIAAGVRVLCRIINSTPTTQDGKAPKLLLLAPASLNYVRDAGYVSSFDESGNAASRELPAKLRTVADEVNAAFFDLNDIVTVSNLDGIHMEAAEHAKIAEAVYACIQQL